jgi:DNA polymerase IV (DinB-like DNA polymerase)
MHIDFDYFFAQCEELRRPDIRQKPVVVCVFSGRTEDSGVVSTANYVARKHGVKSGIPIKLAKSRLADAPDALFLPLDRQYYEHVSDAAMSSIRENADLFEQVGIDECYIDVSGRTDLDGAKDLAIMIKTEVRNQAGISCSVGIAPNKLLAKIASDMQKPDGLTVIGPEHMAGLDVDKIPGIGPKTKQRLAELGVQTAGQLAAMDMFQLIEEFGKKSAAYIHNAAQGINDEPVVESEGQQKQLMRIMTLKKDASESSEMYADLESLCRSVFQSAMEKSLSFRTVGIILILDNLQNVSRSRTLKMHSSSLDLFFSTAKSLLDETMSLEKMSVRRLGVRVSDFQSSAGQNTLFDFMR